MKYILFLRRQSLSIVKLVLVVAECSTLLMKVVNTTDQIKGYH
jgi:hypothetical protein